MRYEFTKSLLLMAAIAVPAMFVGGVAMALPPSTVTSTGTVNLTATRQSALLPDGNAIPMWGYCLDGTCGTSWSPNARPGDPGSRICVARVQCRAGSGGLEGLDEAMAALRCQRETLLVQAMLSNLARVYRKRVGAMNPRK